MNIVFFGTSNFALPILEVLHKDHTVVGVVTTPDSLVGRKKESVESPVSALAKDLSLKIFKPVTLKNNDVLRLELSDLNADVFVVASYGKIIPQEIIDIPQYKTINAHPSLLPKYRGPAPIQYALLNGDTVTGTSIMVIDSEMDHGPILTSEHYTIEPDDNFFTLSDKLARASARLISTLLPDYINGRLTPLPQDHAQATLSRIITKEDGKVDWNKTSSEIYNQFRALYPWPGVWTTWNGKIIKITDCVPAAESSAAAPGTFLDGGLVTCGNNSTLKINTLQLEGKNETAINDFLNGYKSIIGAQLA